MLFFFILTISFVFGEIVDTCHKQLYDLGQELLVDKFWPDHIYEDLYCDAFEPIKNQALNMLEIGFGCG